MHELEWQRAPLRLFVEPHDVETVTGFDHRRLARRPTTESEIRCAGVIREEKDGPAYFSNQYSASNLDSFKFFSGSKTVLSRWMPRTPRYLPVPPVQVTVPT